MPEFWFRDGAGRPWSSSNKPWGCKIVDADFDTAIEKDPKFFIQCDDPKWPDVLSMFYSDVRSYSQIKHAPVDPFPIDHQLHFHCNETLQELEKIGCG